MNVLLEIIETLESQLGARDEFIEIRTEIAQDWLERLRRWCETWGVEDTK